MEKIDSSMGSFEWHGIFPCTVCSLGTNSIEELHNHQKYFHSTEELSLAVICLVRHICLEIRNHPSGMGLNDPMLKYPPISSAKYRDNNSRLGSDKNLRTNVGCSNNCFKSCNSKEFIGANEMIMQETGLPNSEIKIKPGSENPYNYLLISGSQWMENDHQIPLNYKMINDGFDPPDLLNLQFELNRVSEISYDTFVNSVEGFCKELKNLDQNKKKGFKKSVDKKNKRKITTCVKRKSESFAKEIREKIVSVQTYDGGKSKLDQFKNNIATDLSCANDKLIYKTE